MGLSSFGCKCIRYTVGVWGSSGAGGVPINKMGDQPNENLTKQNSDRTSLGNFSFELIFNFFEFESHQLYSNLNIIFLNILRCFRA